MDVPAVATVSMVLRKRSRTQNERLVLHLSSPPPNLEPSSDSEFEPEDISANPSASTSSKRKEVVFDSGRQFKCGFEGCSKSYTKPSRLAEHERTHTGEVRTVVLLLIKSDNDLSVPMPVRPVTKHIFENHISKHIHALIYLNHRSHSFVITPDVVKDSGQHNTSMYTVSFIRVRSPSR